MNIKNNDLELLRTVCADLNRSAHSMRDVDMAKRVVDLEFLVERLEQQRDEARKRTAESVKEKRKSNPLYGRSEKEIERILNAKRGEI